MSIHRQPVAGLISSPPKFANQSQNPSSPRAMQADSICSGYLTAHPRSMSPAKKKSIPYEILSTNNNVPTSYVPPLQTTSPRLTTQLQSPSASSESSVSPRSSGLAPSDPSPVHISVHRDWRLLLTGRRESCGGVAGCDRTRSCRKRVCDLAVADDDLAAGAAWVCVLAVRKDACVLLMGG